MSAFSEDMRHRRLAADMSLRELGRRSHIDPGYLSRVEAGRQEPSAELAKAIDTELGAGGALAAKVSGDGLDDAARESASLSRLFAEQPDDLPERVNADAAALAVAYLASPATQMREQANEARRAAVRALRSRRVHRPGDVADLTIAAGYLSGILAYSALDLGNARAALTHAAAAWDVADALGDDQLRAWVRGTQSLILRFVGDYPTALARAVDGLRYANSGTARVRLLCGVAQCYANLGDSDRAQRALTAAASTSDRNGDGDRLRGLFTFSEAKRAYYSASSGIWLPEPADLQVARVEAERAIDMWAAGDPADRSLDDEALARVYSATASVQLGDLESAAAALEPILGLPPERRISWIVKRLDRVVGMLTGPPYERDPFARELRDRIAEYR